MKIQLLILNLCVVTFAQYYRNSESETKQGHYYRDGHRHQNNIAVQSEDEAITGNSHTGKHTNGVHMPAERHHDSSLQRNGLTHNREWNERHEIPIPQGNDNLRNDEGEERNSFSHNREWHERHEIPIPQGNGNGRNDGDGERKGFTHNREWHERHGIPMPQGNSNGRNDGKRCHHFLHSRVWHERHGIAMPDNPQPCTTTNTIPTITTTRATARPTHRTIIRTTTRATARPTTVPPESSGEIYYPRRKDEEYTDTEWNQMP